MFRSIAGMIARELSGHRAKHHVVEIHGTDRFSSFDRYQETARYCQAQMEALGLEGVESVSCRADGRTAYGDWVVPRAWDAREAILWIVDSGHVLARYPDVLTSLYMYSAPTPLEGIETELIEVRDLTRIPDDFRGRLVFLNPVGERATVGKEARKALAARGIVGVVANRGELGLPDLRGWDNYTFAPRNEEGMFGFSLSFRESEYLRQRCRAGPVQVHARVDAQLYDGTVESITGYIPGTGEEEVLILAHIYEQGANDNASGAGLSLEACRTLKALIDGGELPRPRRNIRILLGFECCGFMGYVVAHEEQMRSTVAAINPDMVGEDIELCGTSFGLHLTPGALPSCVDALAIRLFEDLHSHGDPLFRWRREAYTICDSFIADPTIGVPTVSVIGMPDRFYHSSMDTPDKVSPRTLEQIGLVLATYLYFLADAGPAAAAWLAEEAAAQARCEMVEVAGSYLRRLQEGAMNSVAHEAAERLAFLADRHGKALASALRFAGDASSANLSAGDVSSANLSADDVSSANLSADDNGVAAKVERLKGTLRSVADAELNHILDAAEEHAGLRISPEVLELSGLEARAASIIPVRCVVGPLTLEPLLLREEGPFRWSPGWSAPHNDHLIWADGERSVLEIWRCARLESGRKGTDLQEIVDYFEFLGEQGYVEICNRQGG
jgi:hypothetical protein